MNCENGCKARARWAVGIGGGWMVVCDECRRHGLDEEGMDEDQFVRVQDEIAAAEGEVDTEATEGDVGF